MDRVCVAKHHGVENTRYTPMLSSTPRDDTIGTPRDRKKLYAANRRGSPKQAPDAPKPHVAGNQTRRAKTLEPRALDGPNKPRVAASLDRTAKTLF